MAYAIQRQCGLCGGLRFKKLMPPVRANRPANQKRISGGYKQTDVENCTEFYSGLELYEVFAFSQLFVVISAQT